MGLTVELGNPCTFRAQRGCVFHLHQTAVHVIWHATASHLLQAGIDISVIALWLDHESVDTTRIYMEADLTYTENALSRLQPVGQRTPRFHATDKVIAFLAALVLRASRRP